MTDIEIRNSEIGTFMECRRKWLLSYLRRLELARGLNDPTPNLSQGTILHAAHEEFWTKGTDPAAVVSRIEREVHDALPAGEPLSENWAKIFKMARVMAHGYKAWVESGALMNERIILVEYQMRVEYRPGVFITGRIDRLVQDTITNELILKDVKSVQSFVPVFSHQRPLLTYAVLLRMHGYNVSAVTTEQWKKNLQTAAAKPPFYDTAPPLPVTDEMLDAHQAYMEVVIDEMLALRAQYDVGDTSQLYPNAVDDCSWKCDFLPVCKAMTSLDDYEHILTMAYRPRPEEDTI